MFINIENIEVPFFNVREDAETWLKNFCGIRLWHATRVLDINEIYTKGLKIPVKRELDDRLLDFLKLKPWYTSKVDEIVYAHSVSSGEQPAIYTIIDKCDLHLKYFDHYLRYGSENWQFIMEVLAGKGYGVGRAELLNYGHAYILGLDLFWEDLDPCERDYVVNAVYEHDFHNCSIALFQAVSAASVSSIEIN